MRLNAKFWFREKEVLEMHSFIFVYKQQQYVFDIPACIILFIGF